MCTGGVPGVRRLKSAVVLCKWQGDGVDVPGLRRLISAVVLKRRLKSAVVLCMW